TVLRNNILGEDVDFDQLVKDVGKSAAYGALTAGILNGGAVAVNGINSVNTNIGTNTNAGINSSDSYVNGSSDSSVIDKLNDVKQEFLYKKDQRMADRLQKQENKAMINKKKEDMIAALNEQDRLNSYINDSSDSSVIDKLNDVKQEFLYKKDQRMADRLQEQENKAMINKKKEDMIAALNEQDRLNSYINDSSDSGVIDK